MVMGGVTAGISLDARAGKRRIALFTTENAAMSDQLPIVCGKPLNELTDEDFRSVEWLRYLAVQNGLDTDAQLPIQDPCRWAAGEIDRLRLTDAEREAVEFAANRLMSAYVEERQIALTLRSLLARSAISTRECDG